MPVQLSYPGVYIEEVPSGVRTITGVATSIAAFVGRARRGPVNEAVTINGFADFERLYGGLWAESTLGFAVRDFFLNGGGQAIIVRVFAGDATAASATLTVGEAPNQVLLVAASPGTWGGGLSATVDTDVGPGVAESLGVEDGEVFNLTVTDTSTGATETFRNLTAENGPRRIDQVLAGESRLVRWNGTWPPATLPVFTGDEPITADATGGGEGLALSSGSFLPDNGQTLKRGLFALEQADLFNLLCIPPYTVTGDVDTAVVTQAAVYCEQRRALLLVDPPSAWRSKDQAKSGIGTGVGTTSKNAALFFPRLRQPNPLRNNQLDEYVPCGAVAGVFARTDSQRGVWKAPAGLEATLVGVTQLSVPLTDGENGELNPLGVNCLRARPPVGPVVWGARTLQGDDRLASEWKYIPVRRLALYIEESLYRGTQWVVFEPNDEPLWAQIRLNIGAFMQTLFRQGAFQGRSPREAYLVKCDRETTTQDDINRGIVNILVGFAPLKPAEFVIIKIQQLAGQVQA